MRTIHTAVGDRLGYGSNLTLSTRVEQWQKNIGYVESRVAASAEDKFNGWEKVYQAEIYHRPVYVKPR